MRPSVSEQLSELGRILTDVVAPEVHAPYPADILSGVVGALNALAEAWSAIPAFLEWDVAATAGLLADAAPRLDPSLAAEVTAALTAGDNDYASPDALEARHHQLRDLLARAVPAVAGDPDLAPLRDRMVEHFRVRAERFPLSLAPPRGRRPPTSEGN